MRVDLEWRNPDKVAVVLWSWRTVDFAAAEQVDEEVKAAGRRATHLVESDGPQNGGAVAGLLEKFPPCGFLGILVPLHAATGQEPCARERTGGLPDEKDTPG